MSDITTHVSFVSPEFVELDSGANAPDAARPSDSAPPQPNDDSHADVARDGDDEDSANTEPVPLGLALTAALKSGLQARGWVVDYQWTTPYGHAFDARNEASKRRYDVEVVNTDSEHGHWLVTCKQRTGLVRRFFKGNGDPTEHRRLRVDMHGALAANERCQEVRWHTEEDWDDDKRSGTPDPV